MIAILVLVATTVTPHNSSSFYSYHLVSSKQGDNMNRAHMYSKCFKIDITIVSLSLFENVKHAKIKVKKEEKKHF